MTALILQNGFGCFSAMKFKCLATSKTKSIKMIKSFNPFLTAFLTH